MQRKCLVLFTVLSSIVLVAAAPADQVRERIGGLRELGAAFKAVNDGLRSGEPQMILIQQSARQIRNAANSMPGWFPIGSGPQPGIKTAAKPEIWSQRARFQAAQNNFITVAGRFQTAVNGGDLTVIRAETRALGATCKTCHDSFRVPSS